MTTDRVVDFRCTGCGKLLRVPVEAAGRQARCPECGAIQPVPAAAAADVAGSSWGGTSAAEGAQPAGGPALGAGQDIAAYAVSPLRPSLMDPIDAVAHTWAIYKHTVVSLIGLVVAFFAITLVVAGMQNKLPQLVERLELSRAATAALANAMAIGLQVIGLWLQLGVALFMLNVARGGKPAIADLFAGGPFLVTFVLAVLVLAVIVVGTLVFCCLPGVILMAALGEASMAGLGVLAAGGVAATVILIYVFLTVFPISFVIVDRDPGAGGMQPDHARQQAGASGACGDERTSDARRIGGAVRGLLFRRGLRLFVVGRGLPLDVRPADRRRPPDARLRHPT